MKNLGVQKYNYLFIVFNSKVLTRVFVSETVGGWMDENRNKTSILLINTINEHKKLIVLVLIITQDNLANNNLKEPIREVCSLQEIFPAMYGEEYKDLLVMDRTVDIYLQCLGVRGALRMGNTQFRNFTR